MIESNHKLRASLTASSGTLPWLMLMLLYVGIFSLSCRLQIGNGNTFSSETASIAGVVFGEARSALGSQLYETADLYFHRGIAHERESAFNNTPFQRLHEKISPSGHHHAKGQSIREIMPWLWMCIKMDPGKVETYLVAAFWLLQGDNNPALAIKVLTEAQANIPFNYEIQLAKGRIFLRQRDIDNARKAFDATLAFWPGALSPEDKGARVDKGEALLYRALIYESDGNYEAAAAFLREVLEMFPDRTGLLSRIHILEQGKKPELLAESIWNDMLRQYSQEKMACHREEHHHRHGDDHGGCENCMAEDTPE